MSHTPTPWTVYKAKTGTYIGIGDENGEGIVDAGFGLWRAPDEALPNAAFIVKAVNAHDDLVAALKHLSAVYAAIWVKMSDGEMAACRDAWAQAAAALKKAGAL